MKKLLYPLAVLLIIGGGYAAGPKADFPSLDPSLSDLNLDLTALEGYLEEKEKKVANLKPNNQSRIIWADSIRKTPYSIVFLHGFSASPMEGDPVHQQIAKDYGCNLYLPRLAGHGIEDKDALKQLTPQKLLDSAIEALAVGRMIGDQVILMSSSTGGTLSIYLAANHPEEVAAQVLFSPNIALANDMAFLLTYPWGYEIAGMIEGERRHLDHLNGEKRNYWTTTYHIKGVIALQDLIDKTMTPEVFQKVEQPLFLGYYYKNEEEQDDVVSVPAMKAFLEQVQTPPEQRVDHAFPNAGHHVICSRFQSKAIPEVIESTGKFLEGVLGMAPVSKIEELPDTVEKEQSK